ncbi:MAG: discoidin domain-containing protein [Pseudomonadota bacterium]
MKKLIFLCAGACVSMAANSQNWTLEWSDEFSGSSLDQSKWSYETGTGVNGNFGTGQLDRATDRPENVAIEQGIAGADGGALRISTRKEAFIDRNYTSGRINSKNKAAWGPDHRIVARVWAKGVRTQGQGFAFWMMPNEAPAGQSDISWPQGGEIDIMEYVGSIPGSNLGTVHYAWQYNNNSFADWNHGSQGGYYNLASQQAPDSPEWISVDLGAVFSINRVNLNWESAGKSYQVQTSTDGSNWSTVYTTTNGASGVNDITFGATNARFVRMVGTQRSNDWGYALFEFQVFPVAGNTNIALNRPATASSLQANDLVAANAFDGNTGSRWGSALRNPSYQCCAQSSFSDPNIAANGWHTYGIDWYKDRLEFFVDGNVYHVHYLNDGAVFALDGQNQADVRVVNGKKVRVSEYSNLFNEWHPFEHKMYAILSSGVGGSTSTYGGPIANEAMFPADVYIDWVRVFANSPVVNIPPAVALTAPNGTATYSAPATVILSATASDNDGSIASVAFYNGNTLLGTVTNAPYTFNWNNVAAGTYTVKAVATDNAGATTSSNTAPVVVTAATANLALNKPATASTVVGSFVAVNAFDTSLNTRWESAYTDPQWVYVDLGSSYNISGVKITWETAMAKDYQIQVSSDANNWTSIKSVTGNTSAVNDLGGLSRVGRYVRMLGTARTTGYGYSIFGMEVYGQTAGNTAPTVNLSGPANNATFTAPANINFTADAADQGGSVAQVQFYNGSTLLGTDTSSPFTYNWSNVVAGTYSITAKATDNTGLTTVSTPITVNVNGSANTNRALNKPATSSSTIGGNTAASAVDGNGGSRWESTYNDQQWMTVDLGASGAISRVKITCENAYGKDYQIQASSDGNSWSNLKTVVGNTALVNDWTGLSGNGRYVRINGTARGTGYGYSIFELEVY